MNPEIIWYFFFIIVVVIHIFITITTRDRKYQYYLLFGALLGYYFDYFAVMQGIYSYPDFYRIWIGRIPLTMTLAEGLSVALVVYLYNKIVKRVLISGS